MIGGYLFRIKVSSIGWTIISTIVFFRLPGVLVWGHSGFTQQLYELIIYRHSLRPQTTGG